MTRDLVEYRAHWPMPNAHLSIYQIARFKMCAGDRERRKESPGEVCRGFCSTMLANSEAWRLAEGAAHCRESRVKVRADNFYGTDDDDRNESRDQAVFNRSRTGLV